MKIMIIFLLLLACAVFAQESAITTAPDSAAGNLQAATTETGPVAVSEMNETQ